MNKRGFTITELLIIITVFAVLLTIGIPSLRFFQQSAHLDDAAGEIKSALLLAQNRTLASESAQQYGIFFQDTSSPHQYTLFRGDSFASRDISADQTFQLQNGLTFSQINFGGSKEVVFQRISGEPNQEGFVVVRAQSGDTRTIFVNASGAIFVGDTLQPSDDNRVKDSRHVHIDYTRSIDTANESIIVTFTGNMGSVVQTIKISDNIQAGNIVWKGTVTVDNEIQQLEIRTHRLNAPDSQFSVKRDRRYNTKALQIALSGDSSGTLIAYDANGTTTKGTSLYAGEPIWQ
jgi:Tfp pilus assembly protein FimT